MSPVAVAAVLFGSVGVLLIALGLPLARGRVRPNRLYGLRSRETLADEAIWYRANALLGRGQVALGATLLVLAWGLPWVPGVSEEAHAMACVAGLVVGVLALCLGSQASARRMAPGRAGGPRVAGDSPTGPGAARQDAPPRVATDPERRVGSR